MVLPPKSIESDLRDDGTLRANVDLEELEAWMRAAFEEGMRHGAMYNQYQRRANSKSLWHKSGAGQSVELVRQRLAREAGVAPRPIDELMQAESDIPPAILL